MQKCHSLLRMLFSIPPEFAVDFVLLMIVHVQVAPIISWSKVKNANKRLCLVLKTIRITQEVRNTVSMPITCSKTFITYCNSKLINVLMTSSQLN